MGTAFQQGLERADVVPAHRRACHHDEQRRTRRAGGHGHGRAQRADEESQPGPARPGGLDAHGRRGQRLERCRGKIGTQPRRGRGGRGAVERRDEHDLDLEPLPGEVLLDAAQPAQDRLEARDLAGLARQLAELGGQTPSGRQRGGEGHLREQRHLTLGSPPPAGRSPAGFVTVRRTPESRQGALYSRLPPATNDRST